MLFFIELDSRRVHLAGVTPNPNADWITQQARNLLLTLDERGRRVRFLIRDRDAKFCRGFDDVFGSEGVKVLVTPVQAPNANAYDETCSVACSTSTGKLHERVYAPFGRRDAILEQLDGLPAVRPAGGWSLLMEVDALGTSAPELSRVLVDHKVAATPMTAWGERVAPRYIRFVYSREPVGRLSQLGGRLRAALEQLS